MSTDEDYVYDEASGEWLPARELVTLSRPTGVLM